MDSLRRAALADDDFDGCPGIQIEISDPKLQAYLQRYPWACGPDVEMNRLGVELVSAGIRQRLAKRPVVPVLFYALERRLPIGTNLVINSFTEEALFLARVNRKRHLNLWIEDNGSRTRGLSGKRTVF